MTNILFVYCHPDDEVLWAGGLIRALAQTPGFHPSVLCLSGQDVQSPRPAEFEASLSLMGAQGIVCGGPLRPAHVPLPDIDATITRGCEALGLTEIDLVVTHAPFGDEMNHPHHQQAYLAVMAYAKRHDIPFAYSSCIPMPFAHHTQLKATCADERLALLQSARCQHTVTTRWRYGLSSRGRAIYRCPYAYYQWVGKTVFKKQLLDCYQSVDVATHRKNYSTAQHGVEALYVACQGGEQVMQSLWATLPLKSPPDLMGHFYSWPYRIVQKIRRTWQGYT